MTEASLRGAWSAVTARLRVLQPVSFTEEQWRLMLRLHACFNDRDAHTHLPIPIACFPMPVWQAIRDIATEEEDVVTVTSGGATAGDPHPDAASPRMASLAQLVEDDIDQLVQVLVPTARFRKGHYAYGRFTVPAPHGLHTDHSAEDPAATGEPICLARIAALATHYVVGDYQKQDAVTAAALKALQYWTPIDGVDPEDILATLLARGVMASIPMNHVVLMVAGNRSGTAQITQHIAARPPPGGLHSVLFQRHYRLG